jgi:hypothetical protein
MLKKLSAFQAINSLIENAKKTGKKLYVFPESWSGLPGVFLGANKANDSSVSVGLSHMGEETNISIQGQLQTEMCPKGESATVLSKDGERLHILALDPLSKQEF